MENESDVTSEAPEFPSSVGEMFSEAVLPLLRQIHPDLELFQVRPYPNAEAEGVTGYATDVKRKIIWAHPDCQSLPVYRQVACMGHELGHHFPEVVAFQDACEKLIEVCVERLPPVLSVKLRKKIVAKLENVVADVILESIIPAHSETLSQGVLQSAFQKNRALIFTESDKDEARKQKRVAQLETDDFSHFPWDAEELSKADLLGQYTYLYLVAPFFGLPPREMVAPEIAELYPQFQEHFGVLQSPQTPTNEKIGVFLREVDTYAKLIQLELEKDKDAAERMEFMQRLEELIERAGQITQVVPVPEDTEGAVPAEQLPDVLPDADLANRILEGLEGRGGKGAIREQEIQAKAKEFGVEPVSYAKYLEICEKYAAEIEDATQTLLRFITREYRLQVQPQMPFGIMTEPGRETETLTRVLAGEEAPRTELGYLPQLTPKHLQLCHIVDTSGSMMGQTLETLEYYVLMTQPIVNVAEELINNAGQYRLPRNGPYPIEIEMIIFESKPYIVFPMQGDLSLRSLVKGFDGIMQGTIQGGGTSGESAFELVRQRMRLWDETSLKLISILTDGYDAIRMDGPLSQIAKDPQGIHIVVNGIGRQSQYVIEAYKEVLRPGHNHRAHLAESRTAGAAARSTLSYMDRFIDEHLEE